MKDLTPVGFPARYGRKSFYTETPSLGRVERYIGKLI